MSRLISLLFTLPLALVLSLCLLVYTSLEPLPLVDANVAPDYRDIERVKNTLKQQDPRNLNRGEEARLVINARDLDLALSQAGLRFLNANSRYRLEHERLRGELTWHLPLSSDSPYLNVTIELMESNGEPRLERVKIGRLELPLHLETRLLADFIARLLTEQELPLLHARVRKLHIEAQRMILIYRWDPEIITQARGMAMSDTERQRATVYANALATQLKMEPRRLHNLLSALFQLAHQRSKTSDPVAENRAALTALGLYALGGDAGTLLGDTSALLEYNGNWVRLQGREDLSRHFLVSAAIAAGSDSGLSDAIGVYKEWSDSHGGSGFSFIDLASDRAGTRFGEQATRSRTLARKMQEVISTGIDDTSLLPPVSDLPESISNSSMQENLGGIGGTRYQRITDAIEQRLDAMPLYRLR